MSLALPLKMWECQLVTPLEVTKIQQFGYFGIIWMVTKNLSCGVKIGFGDQPYK